MALVENGHCASSGKSIFPYCTILATGLIGFMAKEPAEIVRYTSIARALEAAGQCIALGINSTSAPLIASLGTNLAIWGIAVIPAYLVVRKVGIIHVGISHEQPTTSGTERKVSSTDEDIHSED